jgi:hypothetical protein
LTFSSAKHENIQQFHRKSGITHAESQTKLSREREHSSTQSEHLFNESEHSSENEHFYFQRQSVFYSDAYISNTLNVPDIVIPYGMENKLFYFYLLFYFIIICRLVRLKNVWLKNISIVENDRRNFSRAKFKGTVSRDRFGF